MTTIPQFTTDMDPVDKFSIILGSTNIVMDVATEYGNRNSVIFILNYLLSFEMLGESLYWTNVSTTINKANRDRLTVDS